MTSFLKKFLPSALLFIVIATLFLMCATPPVSRDALIHHLAVPSLYVEHGGIYELPDIRFSYYPQFLNLIYCIPLMFHNDILPKYIHCLFGMLTALLLFCHIKKRVDGVWALWASAFFLSLPVIIKLCTTVYVDLGLIFFSFASLLSLLQWHHQDFQIKWLIIAAVSCGLALSTKYNGMITAMVLTAFVPFIYLNRSKEKSNIPALIPVRTRIFYQLTAALYGLLFLVIAMVTFSPWMVKNYVWTKNPLYPLYNDFFNPDPSRPETTNKALQDSKQNRPMYGGAATAPPPPSSPSSAAPPSAAASSSSAAAAAKKSTVKSEKKLAWNHFLVRKYIYNETWWETATIPVRIFFQGEDDTPKYFDGRLNPLLFFLPFFAFTGKSSRKEKLENKLFLLFSLLFILAVFFQIDMRIRWISPAIPPLVILSCTGVQKICALVNHNKIHLMVLLSVLILFFGQNLTYLYQQLKKTDPTSYLTGKISRQDYISIRRPEYITIQYANDNFDKNRCILALFLGKRRYYFQNRVKFHKNVFKESIKQNRDPLLVVNDLKRDHYTDIMVCYPMFNTWMSQNFTREERTIITTLFSRYTTKLISDNGYGLYRLK